MIEADLIVEGAAEVVTCAGPSPWSVAGKARQGDIGAIPGGAVACSGSRIVFVGTAQAGAREVALKNTGERLDAKGGIVLPGFIDAHTHLPFGGWREAEFEMRLAGSSYAEIAAAGGGILSTVRATRALPPEALADLVRQRLDQMLACGTTTVEAKSGYGLSVESETTILRALAMASDHPVEIIPTFLGAHVVAPEFRPDGRAAYVRLIIEEMIPRFAGEGLARFCDVFIDEGAFTLSEAREILSAARSAGLGLRAHAEQLTHSGGASLAASLGALSVDHLERLTKEDVDSLAATWNPGSADGKEKLSEGGTGKPTKGRKEKPNAGGKEDPSERRGTVAILLPGAAHTLRESVLPPARALIDAGVPVALATDFNPGTSPCLAMPPILNLACLLLGLTPDETILAATRNPALSLGIDERVGSLEVGKQADLAVWAVPDRRHLAYRFGPVPCAAVVKAGRILIDQERPGSPRI